MGRPQGETRKEERKPVRVFITFRTIDQFFSEIGTNLSLGGVFVKSDNPLPVGTEIKISFNIPQFGCYVESAGVVVHNGTQENPGMGIKFKNLSDRAKKILQDVLDHELLTPSDETKREDEKDKKKGKITVKVETAQSKKGGSKKKAQSVSKKSAKGKKNK